METETALDLLKKEMTVTVEIETATVKTETATVQTETATSQTETATVQTETAPGLLMKEMTAIVTVLWKFLLEDLKTGENITMTEIEGFRGIPQIIKQTVQQFAPETLALNMPRDGLNQKGHKIHQNACRGAHQSQ